MEGTHRLVKTGMLVLLWITLGLYNELSGPTLMDLKMRFNSNYEQIARAVSAGGVGIFVGSLLAGLIVDVVGTWKDLLLTGAQLVVTLTIVSMPLVQTASVMWFIFFLINACGGVVKVVGQRILLEMWQEDAASPMHAIHMGFGIGAMVSPLISNQFLAVLHFYEDGEFPDLNGTSNGTTPYTVEIGDKVERFSIVKHSRVEYAYITIGLITLGLSLPVFVYPLLRRYSTRIQADYENMEKSKPLSCKTFVDMVNPMTYTYGSKALGIFIATMIFLYFMNNVGSEQMFGNFIRTFSVDELHFPRNEASYLDTVFWAGFTAGRLTGSILSHWIPVKILVILDVTLHLTSVTLLDIFSADTKTALWIFTALTGFLISPLFPVFISFLNTQIEVGGVVLTFVTFSTGIGQFLYIWIAGALYQNYGPRTILYGMQASAILLFLIALVSVLQGRKRDKRTLQEYKELSEPNEETSLNDYK